MVLCVLAKQNVTGNAVSSPSLLFRNFTLRDDHNIGLQNSIRPFGPSANPVFSNCTGLPVSRYEDILEMAKTHPLGSVIHSSRFSRRPSIAHMFGV